MNDHYDTMQVCQKWGHKITEYYDSISTERQDFCHKCGSVTIYTCGDCNAKIRGYHHFEGVIGGGSVEVPLHCYKCGKSYPWKMRLLTKRFFIKLVAPVKYLIDAILGIFKK